MKTCDTCKYYESFACYRYPHTQGKQGKDWCGEWKGNIEINLPQDEKPLQPRKPRKVKK